MAIRLICGAAMLLPCCGCGVTTLVRLIPTFFSIQSRLEGCPDSAQAPLGATLELTFVLIGENETAEAVDGNLTWRVRDGSAIIDDSGVNPVTVSLTEAGVVTIRADYDSHSERVNPAICTVLVGD